MQTMPTRSDVQVKVDCLVKARIPTFDHRGTCWLFLYSNNQDSEEHLAIVYGDDIVSTSLEAVHPGEDSPEDRIRRGAAPNPPTSLTEPTLNGINGTNGTNGHIHHHDHPPTLTRIHSACFTGETLGSARCDCAEQLADAMSLINKEGSGVIIYLKQEGRGIGLKEKLKAYNLIDQGHDTLTANVLLGHPVDARSYEIAAAILKDLSITSLRLLTNNPDKISQLESQGIHIDDRIPMVPKSWRGFLKHSQSNVSSAFRPNIDPPSASPSRDASRSPAVSEVDEYIITKVEKMNHMLDVPKDLLSVFNSARQSAESLHSRHTERSENEHASS
ncbi:GTP cyclohydrolase II-domain-containing protein [Polychytrium aggregatum]|uniref:GTP cyclohydrolase II-domain-containing protein n=1 Tax=Polychytrium aggregatum TaxID=110093 RepID=UPI0022FDC176|nr:GTP cyclohydrolase II-domain-containing protein [Polychytrium aggregatum]KAI9208512.1 GTP cyclohydrolase II-domain-containing protein [Polychytrium aggregatum]